ncbi:MAG: cyclic 2,3-diphosphoglycerate synthase [Acidobacteriota bacterium]
MRKRVLIMGAAGRDFHNFNVYYRDNPEVEVVAFTAYQIPNIAGRIYPPSLAGPHYPKGIPIFDEAELPELIQRFQVDEVIFAYSDLSHEEVMHRASLANACGANFGLLGVKQTQLQSSRPVISVGAIRTGCGKSQTSRRLAQLLREKGKRTVIIRHPMPYGDLEQQACQRFATLEDLDRYECTIEEREEYEGHIRLGHVVYAGVDYGRILASAEKEADIILWDGGNNDVPFYRSNLHVVLVDPLRPGHEVRYHPGETNLRLADVVLMLKVGSADPRSVQQVRESVRKVNPQARLIEADSVVTVTEPEQIRGKRVLVVEDGPTLTHGEMTFGAGFVAASKHGAAEIVDPRPYAVGSIRDTFARYNHVKQVLPAMGYGEQQMKELEQTINAVPCDLVVVGTPIDLGRLLRVDKPMLRVTYEVDETGTAALREILEDFLARHA